MMKLCWVIDETYFYHPDMLAEFIRQSPDQVVGVVIVNKIPPKHNIQSYIIRYIFKLRLGEFLRLVLARFRYAFLNLITKPSAANTHFYSVRKVCQAFSIPFMQVSYTLNEEATTHFLRHAQPDIIISSNSLIFSKRILNIPKYCCINRHSSLLPAYGGLWPVFQALVHGESEVGVSVHIMEKKIDKGPILVQKPIPVLPQDTVNSLYAKCFAMSAELLIEAIDKIRHQDLISIDPPNKPSYFSFPMESDWKSFRKLGKRFS